MKILAIGKNYADHAKEMGGEAPTTPVVFGMPETALLKGNKPFYIPDFTKEVHHEIELVIRICRPGKHIPEKFAHKYYDKIGLGVDFTARDIQTELKAKGLPWEIAKGFNDSAPLSPFLPIEDFDSINDLDFSLEINGELRQKGNSRDMIFSFDQIVAHLSKYFFLQTGDIIYTGTPAGVGAVNIGDRLCGFIGDRKLLDFEVR